MRLTSRRSPDAPPDASHGLDADDADVRARRPCQPGRMPGLVGRRAGALLGGHQRAGAAPLRSAHRAGRRDADAGVDRLASRLRERGGFVVALRDGIHAGRRATARSSRRLAAAPYDTAHASLQRRPLRPAGTLPRRHDERARATRARRRCTASIADGRLEPLVAGHHDQQRPRVQPGRAHDVPRRYRRRARCSATTTTPRPARRRSGATSCAGRGPPTGRTAPRSTAPGNYWVAFYRGGKVMQLAPDGRTSPSIPVPAMCPTMCAFGGPDLRTLYVTTARQQRDADELARLPQSGGVFAMRVDVPGLPGAAVRGLRRMKLDPTAYLRLEAPHSLGTSASGASFATSSGDILEVSSYGPGRVPPAHRPDHAPRLRHRHRPREALPVEAGGAAACGRSPPATPTLELTGAPLRMRLLVEGRAGAHVDHRRALPRLDATADVRPPAPGRPVDRRARAAHRRARVRPRREVRAARQARPAHPFAGRGCARRQHRPRVQERAVRVEPGHGPGRVGRVRAHAGHGHARRRLPGLVAPQLRVPGRGRGARSLLHGRRHAGVDPRPVHPADRTRAGGAALEPRAVGVARLLQDAGGSRRRRRAAARAQGAVRRAHARRPRRVERRDALRLHVGPGALPRPACGARAHQGSTTCACASGNTRTCRSTRRCSRSSRRAATC